MILNLRVIPRAAGDRIITCPDGSLRVYTTAPATENRANIAIIKLLSRHFNVPKTGIKIIRGKTGRDKVVEI